MADSITKTTGKLFGALWEPFDDEAFEHSVSLFRKRFVANEFDLDWFKGKKCLDVGCGGGRYCIAMAREGAAEVTGVDIGVEGLSDARKRAKDYTNIDFQEASVLDLPFEDASFDFVFCSGILMITENPELGMRELCRVLKPGGNIYLLLYATGGVRWPAIMDYRKSLQSFSSEQLKELMLEDNFPQNKIRTLLDDLKVPIIDFYHEEYVAQQLRENGVERYQRWTQGRLDHEESLKDYLEDMQWFERLFVFGRQKYGDAFLPALESAQNYIAVIKANISLVEKGVLTREAVEQSIIGQGHHRVLGIKS